MIMQKWTPLFTMWNQWRKRRSTAKHKRKDSEPCKMRVDTHREHCKMRVGRDVAHHFLLISMKNTLNSFIIVNATHPPTHRLHFASPHSWFRHSLMENDKMNLKVTILLIWWIDGTHQQMTSWQAFQTFVFLVGCTIVSTFAIFGWPEPI